MGLGLEMEASDAALRDKSFSFMGSARQKSSSHHTVETVGAGSGGAPGSAGAANAVRMTTIISQKSAGRSHSSSDFGTTLGNVDTLGSELGVSDVKKYYGEVITTTTGFTEDNQSVLALSRKAPHSAVEVLKSVQSLNTHQN